MAQLSFLVEFNKKKKTSLLNPIDYACTQAIQPKKGRSYSWHFDINELAEMEKFKDQRYKQ